MSKSDKTDSERTQLEYPGYRSSFGIIYTNIPYRILAHFVAKKIYRLPITANQISIGAMIAGFIGAYFFSKGIYQSNLIGLIFFNLFYILACSDGLVARLQEKSSILGAYINHITEKFTYPVILFSVCMSCDRMGYDPIIIDLNVWHVGFLMVTLRLLIYDIEQQIFELSRSIPEYEENVYDIINSEYKSNFLYRAFIFNNSNLMVIIIAGTLLNELYLTILFITLYSLLFCMAIVVKFSNKFSHVKKS